MTNGILSFDECIQMLIKEKIDNDVIIHSQMVERLSRRIGEAITQNKDNLIKINIGIMRMGALLHDIGRARTHEIAHVLEGVNIARKSRFPPEVIHIIEMHVGSGLTEKEAEELGLEKKRYFPQSMEAKIVSYADNVISGDRRIDIRRAKARYLKKGLNNAAERLQEAHDYLSGIAGKNLDRIRI